MALPVLKSDSRYSYYDYLSWEDGHWELIDGEVWDMSPAPSRMHQLISIRFSSKLFEFMKDSRCSVYAAPFDVRLPDTDAAEEYNTFTVVQPDISIICDPEKLDERGCVGPPDLVVEILSPSTAGKDLKIKRAIYERHGVQEYWLVHPADHFVMVYLLNKNGKYDKAEVFEGEDILLSSQFEDLSVNLVELFAEE